MKFYLLDSNIGTQIGMRLAGIKGMIVRERHEVLEELKRVMYMEDIAIVLMTTKLVETCPEIISESKLKQKKPLIVEIPSRHGSAKIGETIGRYVSETIDAKL